MMVEMWRSILEPFVQDNKQLNRISLNIQRVCYGFVSQTLLVNPKFDEWIVLEEDILQALSSFKF